MGAPEMTKGMKGGTVYMPEAFGIKSGKSPNFGWIKAKYFSQWNKTSEMRIGILISSIGTA
jgi:hypothetical protein